MYGLKPVPTLPAFLIEFGPLAVGLSHLPVYFEFFGHENC